MRAVSTDNSPETAAGGFVLPNDRVEVVLSKREKTQNVGAVGRYESQPSASDQADRSSDHTTIWLFFS